MPDRDAQCCIFADITYANICWRCNNVVNFHGAVVTEASHGCRGHVMVSNDRSSGQKVCVCFFLRKQELQLPLALAKNGK